MRLYVTLNYIYIRDCVFVIYLTLWVLHLTICDCESITFLLHLTTWDCKYVTLNYMRLYVCYISDTVSLLHLTICDCESITLNYMKSSLLHFTIWNCKSVTLHDIESVTLNFMTLSHYTYCESVILKHMLCVCYTKLNDTVSMLHLAILHCVFCSTNLYVSFDVFLNDD